MIIVYTTNEKIIEYYNINKNCLIEYKIFHPLLKATELLSYQKTNKFVVKSFISNDIDKDIYKENLLNRINSFKQYLLKLRNVRDNNKLDFNEINDNILKYRDINNDKSLLNINNKVKKVFIEIEIDENINDIVGFLCVQNEIKNIAPVIPISIDDDLRQLVSKNSFNLGYIIIGFLIITTIIVISNIKYHKEEKKLITI